MELIKKKYYVLLIAIIIFADQLTKLIIRANFNLFDQVDIVKGLLKIMYIRNKGVIWGMFSDTSNHLVPLIITLLSILALLTVLYIFFKTPSSCRLELLSLAFIAGGAIGNIIDRFFLGYVVDFIDIYYRSFHWPTFNIADSFISIGIVLLLISVVLNKCNGFNKGEKK